jgi:hypothetical protein
VAKEKKTDKLTESLLAGLAQDSENPGAADARAEERLKKVRPEDQFDTGSAKGKSEDDGDEDDEGD